MDKMDKYKENTEMILRDYLALDRTKLANERTMLAYIRTYVGLVASGVSLIELFDHCLPEIIGYIFIIAAFVSLVFGILSYYKNKIALRSLLKGSDN